MGAATETASGAEMWTSASRKFDATRRRTPLAWAVINGQKEIAELLIEKGANVRTLATATSKSCHTRPVLLWVVDWYVFL